MRPWIKSGTPWVWMTAGMVSVSLIAILGVLLLLGVRGLGYFWPTPVTSFELQTEQGVETVVGQIYRTDEVDATQLIDAGVRLPAYRQSAYQRLVVKIGNREREGLDFRQLLAFQIKSQHTPIEMAMIERSENGVFYGKPTAYIDQSGTRHGLVISALRQQLADLAARRDAINKIEQVHLAGVNYQLEQLRLEEKSRELEGTLDKRAQSQIASRRTQLLTQYQQLEQKLAQLRDKQKTGQLVVEDSHGDEVALPLENVLNIWYPNVMSGVDKLTFWGHQVAAFLSESPRDSNAAGGVFPAIFGTVFLVLLMAVIVTPLGVVAAIYLHEYAPKTAFTRLIRIAVVNLAGVPSIVYGVFGLGFFVYFIGGTIDDIFYQAAQPAPVFGTPGILWSALTLAILTLPVVIVSTEEGLARIPTSVRHGAFALGATQSEMLWRVVLPMASPAMMTGLILAVARAAGEVAPLMLVGVVKVAPSLPVDGNFPFLHLERKFMHLGYHIYDVGFQSAHIETARPLVYATSFLLVSMIVALNLSAIGIRHYLREKYRALEL
ncbi:phosphate ABC transporter permease PstA [Salinivibrio costicola]|uniref:phosphate ABC transporter permease PstA n=1 Tax=Salinivibrio costicola TaxID=51367 RepID=UPI0003958863|nr:phosphate ABC transporter permease PstA [Salinivibrio costicola]